MAFRQGSFEWFRDVVGLPGEGIVLRRTWPHSCGGRYLEKTLTAGDATVEEAESLLGAVSSRNSSKFGCHPNGSLGPFLDDLFRRVYQVDASPTHYVTATFARGVFAQVRRELQVNWAAFALVTCHWGKKTFLPHPLWAGACKAATDDIDGLLMACRNSFADSEVASERGSFEWIQDVVGLSGEGIVLLNTDPHLCGGRCLEATLTLSDATDEEADLCFSVMGSRHGKGRGSRPDASSIHLRLFLDDLVRRVYQVDGPLMRTVCTTFARGVYALVRRGLEVNWAAFAVVVCARRKGTFVPHPLWDGVRTDDADGIDGLLLACRNSFVDSQASRVPEQSVDSRDAKRKGISSSRGRKVRFQGQGVVAFRAANAGARGISGSRSRGAGPTYGREDFERGLPPFWMGPILKKIALLERHGITCELLLRVVWKWEKLCGDVRTGVVRDRLMEATEGGRARRMEGEVKAESFSSDDSGKSRLQQRSPGGPVCGTPPHARSLTRRRAANED